jgi:class 3 adenylate cyclase/tetratricopeptide (TPR) repeat protein
MRCSNCGSENPESAKFCGECASPFTRRCPSCGTENSPTAKFCIECAKSLDSLGGKSRRADRSISAPVRVNAETSASLQGERKNVTALFADIKGSTELEQDLDPEEARAIVDPALRLMIDAVQRYDGYIVQSTGDGIFALFGAPLAHEDHPQRALYAALRMQEELRRYGSKLQQGGRAPIEIRVGVNTGEVVVRSISTGDGHTEYTPIGHTANLASRIQTLASTGSIAISESTRKLAEGYFELEPRGPTRVKGVNEAVNVYEVKGVGPLRTRLQRSASYGFCKFVSREAEMAALNHAAQFAGDGRGQIAAVVADPGVGKSRLYHEFKAGIQSGSKLLEAFSVSHGKASAYLPVIFLLHGYFNISGGDDRQTRRAKVVDKLRSLDPALENTMPYLLTLLDVAEGDDSLAGMDAAVRKRRTLDAIKRILLGESLNQPLILMFEDLQWIDEETQAFLNLLVDAIATARILLLVNYRPEYQHQWGGKSYYTRIRLDPLGDQASQELLDALLGEDRKLDPLKRLIMKRTQGNPFFIEETVQVLLDEGALVRDRDVIRITKPLRELKIPPTVQGILAARIDRLPAAEKELLQNLAVIGMVFQLELARALANRQDDELHMMLGHLQLAEFIYEQPAVGEVEYTFKHALTHDVAYNSLLIERRKTIHERIGMTLESLHGEQLDDHHHELAHHFSRSDNSAKAVEHLGKAGARSLNRSEISSACSYLNSALEVLERWPQGPERTHAELSLRVSLGSSLALLKGYAAPEAEANIARMQDLVAQVEDPRLRFSAMLAIYQFYAVRGSLKEARAVTNQMLSIAEASGIAPLIAGANESLGNVLMWYGEFDAARRHLERALDIYENNPDEPEAYPGAISTTTANLSWMVWYQGYSDQALAITDKAIELARRNLNEVALILALVFAYILRLQTGYYAVGLKLLEESQELAERRGMVLWSALAHFYRGFFLSRMGKSDEGLAIATAALGSYDVTGARWGTSGFLSQLAASQIRAGRIDEGLQTIEMGLAYVANTGERIGEPELYILKGEALVGGDPVEAQRCFEKAIAVAQELNAKPIEVRATTSLARLLRDTGRGDEAHRRLTHVYNWFTEGFDTGDLKEAKSLLNELNV